MDMFQQKLCDCHPEPRAARRGTLGGHSVFCDVNRIIEVFNDEGTFPRCLREGLLTLRHPKPRT